MAICEISGKGKMYGHNVSFSQRHTRKVLADLAVNNPEAFKKIVNTVKEK